MIDGRLRKYTRAVVYAAALGVIGAEIKTADPRSCNGGGAHCAGFQCYVQVMVRQSRGAHFLTTHADCHDFCMRGRIIIRFCQVVGAGHDISLSVHQYRTDRYLAAVCGLYRLFQGMLHWGSLSHERKIKTFFWNLRMRVTGGEARGRVLKVPQTDTVRPTTDKMRQQLYNMLTHSPWAVGSGFDLVGAHVLDGFCGTGALGIEALSRGAQSCVFVDFDARVLQIAKDNVKLCRYDSVSAFLMKGCQKMGAKPEALPARDLVLLDPPYRKDLIEPALAALSEGGWVAPGALVVCESERGWRGTAPASLTQIHVRIDGDSQLNVWHSAAA